MSDAPRPDDLAGKQIGGFEILEAIGHGGMATVYRARQLSMKRIIALKVLPRKFVQDDTYMQRFHREVEIVSRLEHRSIVPVHDYGEFDGQPYIVMRYMSGGSVDDLLAKGPLDLDLTLKIIEQIAPALDYAHLKGVLHRDLKPSNILMDDSGDAYLTDFGIARVLGENPGGIGITTQNVVGTPAYMSPEQAQGQPMDSRSDVYALGVTLFEIVTGSRPFQADTPYGVAVLHVTTPPPSPRSIKPDLPIAIEQVIYRAMKKAPDDRYRNALALSEALSRALEPPFSNAHDTQPGIPRPTKPIQLRQTQQAASRPATPSPPHPPKSHTAPYSRPLSAAQSRPGILKRRRSQSVWMSAAIGGVIGCGLLTLLVLIIALVINFQPASGATPTVGPADQSGIVLTLDPTSDAARRSLLGTPGR